MFVYLNATHPILNIQERLFRRDVKHNNDTVCATEILFRDTTESKNIEVQHVIFQ